MSDKLNFNDFCGEYPEWPECQDARHLASANLNLMGFWKRKGIHKEDVCAFLAEKMDMPADQVMGPLVGSTSDAELAMGKNAQGA